MNFVARPPSDRNGVGHGVDDLDEALFAFYRSEMPRPWPSLQLPDRAPSAPTVRLASPAPALPSRAWFRSPRFALAASVALLIGGYALMSAALAPPAVTDNPSLNEGTASPKSNNRDMAPVHPAEDDVDVRDWLEVDGNKPTTLHIQVFPRK